MFTFYGLFMFRHKSLEKWEKIFHQVPVHVERRYIYPLWTLMVDCYILDKNKITDCICLINHAKGYFHLCPRMDFLQTLHINNSLYTNYENVFIELDS